MKRVRIVLIFKAFVTSSAKVPKSLMIPHPKPLSNSSPQCQTTLNPTHSHYYPDSIQFRPKSQFPTIRIITKSHSNCGPPPLITPPPQWNHPHPVRQLSPLSQPFPWHLSTARTHPYPNGWSNSTPHPPPRTMPIDPQSPSSPTTSNCSHNVLGQIALHNYVEMCQVTFANGVVVTVVPLGQLVLNWLSILNYPKPNSNFYPPRNQTLYHLSHTPPRHH